MSELLTTKQLQDLLQVDRITIYRMLNDGRLKGVRIGNQWRFPQSEIDRLLGDESESTQPKGNEDIFTDFPVNCVQEVQEIFAGIIGIGAITVSTEGHPLTAATFSNPFCKLILSSASGCEACQESWRRIARRVTGSPPFQICHAGLCYVRSAIRLEEQTVAWLIAGQFYVHSPNREMEQDRLKNIASKHNLSLTQLTEAALQIPVLKRSQQIQVQEWTPKVAGTVQSILYERSNLMSRLQRIAEISTVHPTLSKNTI